MSRYVPPLVLALVLTGCAQQGLRDDDAAILAKLVHVSAENGRTKVKSPNVRSVDSPPLDPPLAPPTLPRTRIFMGAPYT